MQDAALANNNVMIAFARGSVGFSCDNIRNRFEKEFKPKKLVVAACYRLERPCKCLTLRP